MSIHKIIHRLHIFLKFISMNATGLKISCLRACNIYYKRMNFGLSTHICLNYPWCYRSYALLIL